MEDTGKETLGRLTGGYDPIHFVHLAAIEERHFWFTSRRSLIAALIRRLSASMSPGYRVLEVGCGTGNILGALEEVCRSGFVFGVDRFFEGLSFARNRGRQRLLQADARSLPCGVQFDIVGAFDVIEHLPDDDRILADMHTMLRRGGHIIVTVPASKQLWSEFDEISHHCRRYEKPELESKLRRAGFENIFVSPFMMSTTPLVWWHRRSRVSKNPGKTTTANMLAEEIRIIPVVNGILKAILLLETTLVRFGIRLPFGTSLVGMAQKA